MKKIKNYILMLLVPILMIGCVSKGVSDGVTDNNDTALVTINKTLATNIATNMTYIKHIYDTKSLVAETTYIAPTTNSLIYGNLNVIKDAYTYGEITNADVLSKYNSILTSKIDFFKINSLQTYDNIVTTHSNIVKQIAVLNQETSPNVDHLNHLDIIASNLLIYIKSIEAKKSENAYYIELEESFWLKDYLDNNKTTVSPITYRELLETYNVLDNSTLKEKYDRLVNLINNELNIINGTGVVTNVNQLIAYQDPKITSKYAIKNIMNSTQLDDIKKRLVELKGLYQNYSTNASNISAKEQELFLAERNYLTTFSTDYYYKIRMSGTGLSVQTLNGLDLYSELDRIYKKANPVGDMTKVYIIKNNINYMLNKISSYNAINIKDSYSACVLSAQLLQMLKDEQLFIEQVRINNP